MSERRGWGWMEAGTGRRGRQRRGRKRKDSGGEDGGDRDWKEECNSEGEWGGKGREEG